MKKRSLKDLFHLIKKVLPDEQEIFAVPPETSVNEALSVMREKKFSQIPVVSGKWVIGVFSYRSFSQGITRLPENEPKLLELPIEEFLEDLQFYDINRDLTALIDELDYSDAVLVGLQNRLQGIVTTTDALKYFYKVASPYVMLLELEVAIRELIRLSTSVDELINYSKQVLSIHYEKEEKKLPTSLEEMTLHDYVMILCHKDTWKIFQPAFGGTRRTVYAKLKKLPKLRNIVFHFRRDITIEEYDHLRDKRDWLLKRIRVVEGSEKAQKDE